jgi:hypothetical protein
MPSCQLRLVSVVLMAAVFCATPASTRGLRAEVDRSVRGLGCQVPPYRVVRTRWDQDSAKGVSRAIVIALPDFAPERLHCLVKSLEARYQRPDYVWIRIFSDAQAARSCWPDVPMVEGGRHCPQQHAEYQFNGRTHQRYVELLPLGSVHVGQETLVDLPAARLRPCRLEIANRCMLEMNWPDHPDDTIAALISATIVVTGRIDKQGRPVAIQIKTADARDARSNKVSADRLVRAALEHVKSWRVEEAAQETPFNITFDFGVTDDLSELSLDLRQFPRRITLRDQPSLLKYRVPISSPGDSVVRGNGLPRK